MNKLALLVIVFFSLLSSTLTQAQSEVTLRLSARPNSLLVLEQGGGCSIHGEVFSEVTFTRRVRWVPLETFKGPSIPEWLRAIVPGRDRFQEFKLARTDTNSGVATTTAALLQLELEVKGKNSEPTVKPDLSQLVLPLHAQGSYQAETGNTVLQDGEEVPEYSSVSTAGEAALFSFVSPGLTEGIEKHLVIFEEAFEPSKCRDKTPEAECFNAFLSREIGSKSTGLYAQLLLGVSAEDAKEIDCIFTPVTYADGFKEAFKPNEQQGFGQEFSGYYVDTDFAVHLQSPQHQDKVKLSLEE